MAKQRILTGIRPTPKGTLHLGHYVGALQQWLELQDKYECLFLIADAQALTDYADDVAGIKQSVFEVALDWLAVGLDPERSAFAIQTMLPETFELTHYLASVTPQSWVARNPTLKAEVKQLKEQRDVTVTHAFMGYPVSQAADILLPRANLVPVGEDQVPHIELTRQIARKFNNTYGKVFPLPRAKVGVIGRLVGTDGKDKMSKSLGNVIELRDTADTVKKLVMGMYTDPKRVRADVPGTVEGNPVFIYHNAFNPDKTEVRDLEDRYRKGKVGDVEVKKKLIKALNAFLGPIRERRAHFEAQPQLVINALIKGTERERKIGEETMREVRKAMGIRYF